MPKKTKKDKMMAKLRRVSSSQTTSQGAPQSPILSTTSYAFVSPSDKKTQIAVAEYAIELKTIKSDLFKTIILAIVAFSVEISLYWLLQQ